MYRREHTKLLVRVQVVNPRPSVLASTTGDKPTGLVVHSDTGDLVFEVHFLEQATRGSAIKEVHALASSDAQDARVVGLSCEAVKLAAADGAFDAVLDDGVPRAEIPPSDLSILRCRCEDVVILVPDDGLDRSTVDPWADLIARHGSRRA